MARGTVFVFARAPRYGTVKSRLAKTIGNSETLRIYRNFLDTTLRRLTNDSGLDVRLAITPDEGVNDLQLLKYGVPVVPQGAGDLGQRMMRTLKSCETGPTAIVGSDIAGLTAKHVCRALASLQSHPFVLGPAEDGGYWLIGARRPRYLSLHLLEGVSWSSPRALQDTAARLGNAHVLPDVLTDVDDAASLRAFRSKGRNN